MVQVKESAGCGAEDEVGAPHGNRGMHPAAVPELLPEAQKDVVHEDRGHGEAEGRGAGLFLLSQREPDAQQAKHKAGGRHAETHVPLDAQRRETLRGGPGLFGSADGLLHLEDGHLPRTLHELGLGREDLVEGQEHLARGKALLLPALRLRRVKGVGRAVSQIESGLLAPTIDLQARLAREH